MAEKSGGGFKLFLLIVIALVGAFFLGCGAILMLSPNTELFGIKYFSAKKDYVLSDINEKDLVFTNYDRIEIVAKNASINICYGTDTLSNIVVKANSMGYYKVGSICEYKTDLVEDGSTLKLTLSEPDYSFLQLYNDSIININLNSTTETVESLASKVWVITTDGGNINFGNSTSKKKQTNLTVTSASLTAKTTSGNIMVKSNGVVSDFLSLETDKGEIVVNSVSTAKNVSIITNSGAVTTKDFTNATESFKIKTESSHFSIGEIKGNVELDALSGLIEIKKLDGNLLSSGRIDSTSINIGEMLGDLTVANQDGKFSIVLQKSYGQVVVVGGKLITIGKAFNSVDVTTKSGNINVNIENECTSFMKLYTRSGTINAKFDKVVGANTIDTETGNIKVSYSQNCSFALAAVSESNSIKVVAEGKTIKGEPYAVNVPSVGADTSNMITITSEKGSITLDYITV